VVQRKPGTQTAPSPQPAGELPLGKSAAETSDAANETAEETDNGDDNGEPVPAEDAEDAEAGGLLPDPRSFAEVIALVGERRDVKLKVHLEEHVSLVKFDAGAGSIDLFLQEGAPPQIANELREKLISWTGRRWVVMLSKTPGEKPIAEVRRDQEAAELEALKTHPAVKAVLDEFPDAKIADIRPLVRPSDDETGTG